MSLKLKKKNMKSHKKTIDKKELLVAVKERKLKL
ncbi:MAG: hypothetical protein PG981_000904 [Wolbachia endosymbiont of Ctenocephalides orientis wCori]|nr:MAG: hypothetical protein PG981_000904 [Wolbachia endosymbiont of Ctenocephalides orientis wCori]